MVMYLLTVAAVGLIVSYITTFFVRHYARCWNFVDSPDGHHKYHHGDVALGGGLAIFLSVVITLISAFFFDIHMQILAQPYVDGLLLASAWIVALGLFDDRYGMPGRFKLLGQILAALIMVSEGMVIEAFTVVGYKVTLGGLAIPFTIIWLVGAINSLNLLDGIDGLATTIGIVLCAAIAMLATYTEQTAVAMISTAVAACLLGFLRYNFPPATMFLGDAGSMLIGLIVGTLAITASMKGPATVAMAAPLAIWALPMFDSVAAIMRRKLTGRSIYATDRGHLHHRLMHMFNNNTAVLAVVALCCIITCGGALASMMMQNDFVAIGSVVVVGCILVLTKAFGYVEVKMLATRAKSFGMSLLNPSRRRETQMVSFRLQGNREWELLWQSLIESAENLNLLELKLDINLVAVQEAYHAAWRRPVDAERRELWRAELPLFADRHVVGRLTVAGQLNAGATSCEAIRELTEALEPLEAEILALARVEEEAGGKASKELMPSPTGSDPPHSTELPVG